ncbi:MAG: FecR family protein [Arachidicoccus sp.]|nr:FecR family protein [Arachidicoccus sp.]
MLSDEQIKNVLDRYFSNTCSNEEREAIENWYNKNVDDTQLEAKSENDEIRMRIKAKLDEMLGFDNISVKTPTKIKFRFSAAAAIILLISAGIAVYYWKEKSIKKQIIAETANISKDILPGGNKAILTLADGSEVVLDSVQKGQVFNQGQSNIIKSDDGLLIYQNNKNDNVSARYNTLSTPRSGQYRLVLPDGTKVWLNAASSIRYPVAFAGKERVVEVTGEAYFEVIHIENMPFRVKTGRNVIEDIGTHFNINAYEDEPSTKVSLLEGKVKINTDKTEGTVLIPGQQGQINSTGNIKIEVDKNIGASIAWKNGYFDFEDGENLQGIMRQISRWYDVNVEYEGGISDMHFGGKITRDCNLSEVLKILSFSNIHYRIENKNLIIMK